jgi:hypothetical protein
LKDFKTSPEIIRLAVMLYIRFPLRLRNVEDLLHERGIDVSTKPSATGGPVSALCLPLYLPKAGPAALRLFQSEAALGRGIGEDKWSTELSLACCRSRRRSAGSGRHQTLKPSRSIEISQEIN